jgi:hypothetical protein
MKIALRTLNTIRNLVKLNSKIVRYEKKWHLPNEVRGLPTEIHRTNGRKYYSRYKKTCKQLRIITVIQDIETLY